MNQRINPNRHQTYFAHQPFDRKVETKIACQTTEFLKVRQLLKKCEIVDLHVFLLFNECKTSLHDEEGLLDYCADILTFGLPIKCKKCNKGEMIFSKFGYTCNAWVTEWIRCGNFEKYPKRSECKINDYFKVFEFFKTYQPQIKDRVLRQLVVDGLHSIFEISSDRTREFSLCSNNKRDEPKSNMCNATMVRCDNETLFHCVLVLVDIERNKNSFFKLQIQEIKDSATGSLDFFLPRFFLNSSWGRIGTRTFDSEVKNFASLPLASAEFGKKFLEKTGNDWKNRNNFVRVPGKFSPVEVVHSLNYFDATVPQVAELVETLFDIESSKSSKKDSTFLSNMMPLGKLSYRQYFDAIVILDQLDEAVKSGASQQVLIGLSNKFFTYFPHNFGFDAVPVLDSQLKLLFKRLFANYTLKYEKNNLISRYCHLNANIEYLSPLTSEFGIIKTYSERTAAHGYKIRILEVFKVHRFGETERYAPFKGFPNRYLLWHGSPTLSFSSIITNGLKISEMKNGSMFGRGIYFADMVSKSANYCKELQSAGLLALCEVALGKIYESYKAENFSHPPTNFDSVKGSGLNQPDILQALKRSDGVIIPFGEVKDVSKSQHSFYRIVPNLNFNEYVVYNEAQIKIQYLVRFKKQL